MTSQHDALFAQYTQSWENKDLPQFLACLTDDIIITECYGATYTSKTEAQKWFQHWTAPTENQVVNWEILAKFEDSLKNTDFSTGIFVMFIKTRLVFLKDYHKSLFQITEKLPK